MNTEVKSRIKRVAFTAALFLLIGLLYALFVHITGFGIPCIFRLVTRLKCPGCGMTTAAMCLLRFDFAGALSANAFLILIVIFVGWVLFYSVRRYIIKGSFRLDSGSDILNIGFLVLLLVWAVVRNIFGI